MAHALTLLVFSACLGACAPGIPEIPPPASSVTRREALAASRAYTSMIWRGSLRNVRHGTDGDGIRTDTPDASAAGDDAGAWWKPGMRSIGMPYKWGGFDTPRQFSERLKADAANGGAPAAAGDMGTPEKQAAGDAAVSRFAAGAPSSSPAAGGWTGPFPHGNSPPSVKRNPASPCGRDAGPAKYAPPKAADVHMPGITTAVRSYGTPSPGRRSQVPSEAE